MTVNALAAGTPWYRSLNRSQWNTLFATNMGWLFDGYEVYALILTVGVALHLTESHEHSHTHHVVEHEHAHRHDDGHHTHTHDPVPQGEHSHSHRHDPQSHVHPHGADLHHRHH